MRIDEMVIKANEDGKTYICDGTYIEYSKDKGFTDYSFKESRRKFADTVVTDGWEEKPKRHLTVSEAEKELDCEIDTPDISKLFRPMSEHPSDTRTVILIFDMLSCFHKGFYEERWHYWDRSEWIPCGKFICWIDPADLIKLLPKE